MTSEYLEKAVECALRAQQLLDRSTPTIVPVQRAQGLVALATLWLTIDRHTESSTPIPDMPSPAPDSGPCCGGGEHTYIEGCRLVD